MICKKEICCLEITIAARIVGVLGLIISGIVMSQLISELVRHDGRGKIITLLGIDIDEFSTDKDTEGRTEPNYFILICCLFALAQVIANALLIWGSIVKNRFYAMPWVLCETASLLVQLVGLVFYIKHKTLELDEGVLTAAVVNIVVTVYFWCIVFRAQEKWSRDGASEDIPHGVEDQID